MTTDQRKHVAKAVKDTYLYPYRSKEENAIRGAAWMASWLIGIAVQQNASPQTLGGAYFIFALSLLLEFVPENRRHLIARWIHGFFCAILFVMLLGALLLSFGETPAEGTTPNLLYSLLLKAPPYMGWLSFIMMFIEVLLALTEVHKNFYDEQAEVQQESEKRQETKRNLFRENLNESVEGRGV